MICRASLVSDWKERTWWIIGSKKKTGLFFLKRQTSLIIGSICYCSLIFLEWQTLLSYRFVFGTCSFFKRMRLDHLLVSQWDLTLLKGSDSHWFISLKSYELPRGLNQYFFVFFEVGGSRLCNSNQIFIAPPLIAIYSGSQSGRPSHDSDGVVYSFFFFPLSYSDRWIFFPLVMRHMPSPIESAFEWVSYHFDIHPLHPGTPSIHPSISCHPSMQSSE